MKGEQNLSMALVHYPVRDRDGGLTSTAVTPLTVHDMARVARTYDMESFYVVTPLKSQQALVQRIDRHWSKGFGAEYNPSRMEALKLVRLVDSLNEATQEIMEKTGKQPRLIATGASGYHRNIGYGELKEHIISRQGPYLLLFGTAWGLDHRIMDECDFILDPIEGVGEYNHLPVRAAAAIIIDRLLSRN